MDDADPAVFPPAEPDLMERLKSSFAEVASPPPEAAAAEQPEVELAAADPGAEPDEPNESDGGPEAPLTRLSSRAYRQGLGSVVSTRTAPPRSDATHPAPALVHGRQHGETDEVSLGMAPVGDSVDLPTTPRRNLGVSEPDQIDTRPDLGTPDPK